MEYLTIFLLVAAVVGVVAFVLNRKDDGDGAGSNGGSTRPNSDQK